MKPPTANELDDLIFANRKIEALRFLVERRNIEFAAAIEALSTRYRELRNEFPNRFTCSDAEYWQGSMGES